MARFVLIVTSLLALISASVSAQPAPTSSDQAEQPLEETQCLGLITAGGESRFWRELATGAAQAAAEQKFELIVKGLEQSGPVTNQAQLIKDIVANNCSAIIIAPSSLQLAQQASRLQQDGMVTVFIDRDFQAKRHSAILTDNYATGERAAIAMAQELKQGADVAVFRLSRQVISTSERVQGFMDGATMQGLNVIVDEEIGTDLTLAHSTAAQLLAANPTLAGVFTPNDLTSEATLLARQDNALTTTTLQIGVDANQRLLNALASEQIHSLFLQRPFLMGYQGVTAAAELVAGYQMADIILTESTYVTSADLGQAEIQELLKEASAASARLEQ